VLGLTLEACCTAMPTRMYCDCETMD